MYLTFKNACPDFLETLKWPQINVSLQCFKWNGKEVVKITHATVTIFTFWGLFKSLDWMPYLTASYGLYVIEGWSLKSPMKCLLFSWKYHMIEWKDNHAEHACNSNVYDLNFFKNILLPEGLLIYWHRSSVKKTAPDYLVLLPTCHWPHPENDCILIIYWAKR